MGSQLTASQTSELLETLKHRFDKHKNRHKGIAWADVAARLEGAPGKLWSLYEMEASGGEPDVVAYGEKEGACLFFDCAAESPKGRRSFCYDQDALESRKENKPKHSAVGLAEEIGIQLLTEEQYRYLQELGAFDLKTSSWIATPDRIRELGGALFCDRRFDHVFTYHNGAESYYAARGFRGCLAV